MKLIHVTDKLNLDSIMEVGLDPELATQKRKAVWAVSPGNEEWAIVHTLTKKRARGRSISDHVVIEIDVPRAWLRRHKRGVWYCYKTITKERFVEVREATECGQSYP